MEIKVVKARRRDLNFLYKLRNSRSVRSLLTNTKKINYQSHCSWFKKTFKDKNIRIFLATLKSTNRRIGYCRFNTDKLITDVSIVINDNFRGNGLSKKILDMSEKKINFNTIFKAQVKKSNFRSKKLFISQNYKQLKSTKDYLIFIKHNINNKKYQKYLNIINKIEQIRSKNNVNWMNILRESFFHSPRESAMILSKIYEDDRKISSLAKRLTN